jgi:hypothetical protein
MENYWRPVSRVAAVEDLYFKVMMVLETDYSSRDRNWVERNYTDKIDRTWKGIEYWWCPKKKEGDKDDSYVSSLFN